ncbi:MAG TPA: sigma-70 family RNA polymerase sigma factor [Puia sp.]|nr:sigma-70 family RNA polymerase sigma factor [Puia sp.]
MSLEIIYNEKDSLERIAQGDRVAFKALYRHYFKVVQKYISLFVPSRDNLDELTQDVFVRIWEKRGRLAGIESFQGYLFMLTRNMVFNYIRSMRVQQKTSELNESMDRAGEHHAEHAFLYKQYYSIAVEGMEKLPPGRKKILKMSVEEGLTLDEIAERLKITRAGVKKQLYAATAFVRQYLLEHAEMSLLLFAFLSLFDKYGSF